MDKAWGHLSNFKVTQAEKSTISWIWIQFERYYEACRNYQITQICLVDVRIGYKNGVIHKTFDMHTTHLNIINRGQSEQR